MRTVVRTLELWHHGIKGQKWGVRNGPPYPLEDGKGKKSKTSNKKTKSSGTSSNKASKNSSKEQFRASREEGAFIPKGSIVKRVTTVENEKNEGITYVSTLDKDTAEYILDRDYLWGSAGGSEYYQVDLEVTSDIRAPAMNVAIDTAFNQLKNRSMSDILKEVYNTEHGGRKATDDALKNWGKLDVKECREQAFDDYYWYMMRNKDLAKTYFDSLKKMGYNAIIDYEDATASGYKQAPLVIFDRGSSLKQKSSRVIDRTVEAEAERIQYEEWKKKSGG